MNTILQKRTKAGKVIRTLTATLLFVCEALARTDGGVIINEIGNAGTKKSMYTGGEYVELLITKPGGVTLAGWSLTDLSSPSGTWKENEGSVKFSESDSSVFRQPIPQGTYLVICLGSKEEPYGGSKLTEDVSLTDGNNRIVVFAYGSPKHVEPKEGRIVFTGKDNLALVSEWKKNAAIDVVTWGSPSSWTGCVPTELSIDMLDNGKITYFVPIGKNAEDFINNTERKSWIATPDADKATPGRNNPGVE